MNEIILYDYWRSSAAYRVRIGLNLLGLPWTSKTVNLLTGAHKDAAYLEMNPQGLVPTIQLDEVLMTQSLSILEYLNETRNAGWLPEDAKARAQVRALSYAIAIDIHPVCNLSVAKYATENSNGGVTMESWMRQFIPKGLAAYEKMLTKAGRYSVGDSVTLADICLVPQLYNAARWGVPTDDFPNTLEIGARLNALPAFEAAKPEAVKPKEA